VFEHLVARVMWVGRATIFLVGLSVILAVLFGVASAAFAGNGDAWRLGQINVATNITKLGGEAGVNGPMLRLINNDAGTDDTALELQVQPGEAPLKVNSTTRVPGFNADQLDGKDSTQLLSSNIYKTEAPTDTGTKLGDGTEVKAMSCDSGDRLLSGGPASVASGSKVLDSFPTDGRTWQVRISPVSGGDNFTVVILCVNQ